MTFITIVRIQMSNRYCWPKQDAEIVRWAVKAALSVMVPEGWGANQWTVTRPFLRPRRRS